MAGLNPEMAERHRRVLSELAEITLDAARNLGERLQAAGTAAEAKDLAMGLARVSRQVRQAVLLEAKLERDGVLSGRDLAREEAAELKAAADQLTEHRRARVLHEVTRAIAEHAESAEKAEELLVEARFTLNAWVHGHDWETRSLDELIADMCHDLGIGAPWEEETDAAETDPATEAAARAYADWLDSDAPGPFTPPDQPSPPDGGCAPGTDSS